MSTAMTQTHQELDELLRFRFSLLRLMTVPHATTSGASSKAETRKLEKLVQKVPAKRSA